MRTIRASCLALIALAVGACADHEIRGFDSAVNQASDEVADHRATIAVSPSMEAARDELHAHALAFEGDLRHIRSHLSDLDWYCDEWDMDRVWDKLYDVEDRFDVYVADSGRMTEMNALRAICDNYALDMSRLLAELRHRLDDAWCW